jgi:hypothetical protein
MPHRHDLAVSCGGAVRPDSPMKTLSEIHAWDDFLQAFEKVFHTEWADTSARLEYIGTGTFFQPEAAAGTASWEARNKLFEAYRELRAPIDLAVIEARKVEDELEKSHLWLTGEVIADTKGLKFRAMEAVYDNPPGAVCALGAKMGLENYFLPAFLRAAERNLTLRLYGVFIATPLPHEEGIPPAAFIVSKMHLPDQPDVLPEDEKIAIQPGDRIAGYRVRTITQSESLVEQVLREFEMLQHHARSCTIIMSGFIELLVNTLIQEKCQGINEKSVKTHGQRIGVLHAKKLIDDDEFNKLEWFRKLRNEAAHEAVFDIGKKNFDLFKGTQFESAARFPGLCMDVFVRFWNKNKDTFKKLSPKGDGGEIVGSILEGRVFDPSKMKK